MPSDDKSIDLTGIGKLAKSIPPYVYNRTTETITTTFEKLIAPITETTSGLGRYIRQKFDNMVDIEKSLLIYSIQRVHDKLDKNKIHFGHAPTPKTLIKTMEEVSKETDPLLNVLWTNLLYSQLVDQRSHPYFVNILSNLSAKEALLLESLNSFDDIGEISKPTVLILPHKITSWVNKNEELRTFVWVTPIYSGHAVMTWNAPGFLFG
jgi:hypothetical protein